jgi:ribosomal protein S12 methylthiotransferase accessory factor
VSKDNASQKPREPILFRGKAYRSSKVFRAGTHRTHDPNETFKTIKPYLDQAGVTRIADVTGLDSVGVPVTLAFRPNALTMACSSGKGVTVDQAYVSGAMEAFELYSAETASLDYVRACYKDLSIAYSMPTVEELPLAHNHVFGVEWPLHWFFGWDLITQSEIPVPAATIGMSRSKALIASIGSFQITSNGLGAGNSFLEAITAGLYEVVERDAIACSFYASIHKSRPAPVVPDTMLRSYALVANVLERCDRAQMKVSVYDCMIDTKIPTYSAFVYDSTDRGVGVVKGSGTHLDPEVAILRAITEALQGRLNFIAGSRDDVFRTAFVRVRADWSRAVAAIEHLQRESPRAEACISQATDTFEEDLAAIITLIRAAGAKHIVVADLTPPDFPVFVVRVIVPGFEGYMHHGYRPGRRAQQYPFAKETP